MEYHLRFDPPPELEELPAPLDELPPAPELDELPLELDEVPPEEPPDPDDVESLEASELPPLVSPLQPPAAAAARPTTARAERNCEAMVRIMVFSPSSSPHFVPTSFHGRADDGTRPLRRC